MLLYSIEEIFDPNVVVCSMFTYSNTKIKNDFKFTALNIIITINYFLFFFVIIFILRYIRLNQEIKIPFDFIRTNIYFILFIIIIVTFNFQNIRVLFIYLLHIKIYLWSKTSLTLELIHIELLRFNWYFKFMEALYKISFLWISYINHHPNIYTRYPRTYFRKFLNLLYKKPLIFYLGILFVICVEIYLTQGYIFYGLYIIFVFIILRPICSFLNSFASYPWEKTCCIADYYHLNWENPHYPKRFLLWFYNIRADFNNKPDLNEALKNKINNDINSIENKLHLQNKRLFKLNKKIHEINSPFCFKIKLAYNKWSNVRWTHTTTIIPGKLWHPMTAFFAKNAVDYGALINNNWNHYHIIEKLKSRINYGEILYNKFENPFKNQKVKIATMIEHNLITNFGAFHERNVKIFTYNKNFKTDTHNQAQDDIQIDPRQAKPSILDCRTHALDQKATPNACNIPEPYSKILSSISPMEYQEVLNNFRQLLLNNIDVSPLQLMQIDNVLSSLAESCTNLNLHQIIWLENLHFFPNNYIPPLRIPHNFCIENLLPEVLQLYLIRKNKLQEISNKLYEKNVPCDYDQAGEILNESFIQALLEQ